MLWINALRIMVPDWSAATRMVLAPCEIPVLVERTNISDTEVKIGAVPADGAVFWALRVVWFV